MTTANILEGSVAALREHTIELIADLARTLGELDESSSEDRQRLDEIARDLRDMFFMVGVIGEFNAGKSSFVNALIGENLLPTGITPTTEFIELIRFNENPQRVPVVRQDGLREWAHPNTGATAMAIVDTPGTGSVFQKHEVTAKRFLHRSDLVIFVISAKRAFADNERIYLELVKSYSKKVILVINQIDLLQPAEQLEVRRFIETQVKETLDLEPLIFMLSAKQALAGEEGSGIDAVRAHLRGLTQETSPARQKLLAQLDTAERILTRHIEALQQKQQLVTLDLSKVKDVRTELDQQSDGLKQRMKEAGANISQVLEGIRKRGMAFIDANLTLRRLGRGLDQQKLQDEFQEVVIGRSLRDINETTGDYINSVVDQSRLYWRNVIDRLNQLRELLDQEVAGADSGIYAEQRASLQDAIRIAETELKSYSDGAIVRDMEGLFRNNLTRLQGSAFVTVSGLAILIASILTPGPLLGVGAAPLAAPAFAIGVALSAVAGVPAVRYLRRVNRETKEKFNERVDHLLKNYNQALEELTQRERNRLMQYGEHVLAPVFSRLELLANKYEQTLAHLKAQHVKLTGLHTRVENETR